jgi:hypothetical protein
MSGPKCRHAQNDKDDTCRLPPGVVVCPCLGVVQNTDSAAPIPVAKVFVDPGGQLVWQALGSDDRVTDSFSFVATREPGGRGALVALAPTMNVQPQRHQGRFGYVLNTAQNTRVFIEASELYLRGQAGEEFVLIS